jgi:CheY-like chemotaxis protein
VTVGGPDTFFASTERDVIDSYSAATRSSGPECVTYMRSWQADGNASHNPSPARPASPTATLAGRSMLVIEDDDDAREVLALMLRSCGALPRTAASGEDGLRLMDEERFDAVICDLGLPGMDGFEVARHVRSSPTHGRVRLIALTGFGQTADVRKASEAGFDAHLTKPVEAERLLRLLLDSAGSR